MYGISPSFVTRANVSNNCEYMQDKGIIVTHGCWPLSSPTRKSRRVARFRMMTCIVKKRVSKPFNHLESFPQARNTRIAYNSSSIGSTK